MLRRTFLVSALIGLCLTATGFAYLQLADPGTQMTEAAEKFLASLDEQQRAKAQMEYETPERFDWHFIPKSMRKGLQISEMNEAQRKAAHELLRSSLSEVGYDKSTKIMALESLLRELEKDRQGGPIRDPERYYFTIFGQPTSDGQWGLSVEGHHLSLNFAVEDGRVISSTPTFLGVNPAEIKQEVSGIAGLEKGLRILKDEEALGFELLHSLNDEQRSKAVIAAEPLSEIISAGKPQPEPQAPVGISARELTQEQRQLLRRLIQTYAANVPQAVAQQRLQAIRQAGSENVHFAWAGADQPGVGHYYRIQGPTFLIELVNTQPDASGNPANHIHSVWRDLRGDFGVALEKQP